MHPELQSQSPAISAATAPQAAASAPQRESLLAAVFILFTSATFFLIQYDRMRIAGPFLQQWISDTVNGAKQAPEQYRIAVPFSAHFLQMYTHLKPEQSIPLIEFFAYAATLLLLCCLLRSSPQFQEASRSRRLVVLGFFFATVQFPVLWIFPWERAETLPTAFYLAAVVLLAVSRGRMPFLLLCLAAMLLTLAQSLVRADVPVALGIALLLAAAMPIPLPRPRSQIAALGLLCGSVGGGMQLYLQHVVYPTAAYAPTTAKVQLFANFDLRHAPLHLPTLVTAILPLLVAMFLQRRYRLELDSSDKLAFLICLLYLPVWVMIGIISEVRIFVPYLFLASPTIAKLWSAFLCHEEKPVIHLAHLN